MILITARAPRQILHETETLRSSITARYAPNLKLTTSTKRRGRAADSRNRAYHLRAKEPLRKWQPGRHFIKVSPNRLDARKHTGH